MYQCFYESVEVVGKDCMNTDRMNRFIDSVASALEDYRDRVAQRAEDKEGAGADDAEDEEMADEEGENDEDSTRKSHISRT